MPETTPHEQYMAALASMGHTMEIGATITSLPQMTTEHPREAISTAEMLADAQDTIAAEAESDSAADAKG